MLSTVGGVCLCVCNRVLAKPVAKDPEGSGETPVGPSSSRGCWATGQHP